MAKVASLQDNVNCSKNTVQDSSTLGHQKLFTRFILGNLPQNSLLENVVPQQQSSSSALTYKPPRTALPTSSINNAVKPQYTATGLVQKPSTSLSSASRAQSKLKENMLTLPTGSHNNATVDIKLRQRKSARDDKRPPNRPSTQTTE